MLRLDACMIVLVLMGLGGIGVDADVGGMIIVEVVIMVALRLIVVVVEEGGACTQVATVVVDVGMVM